MDGTRFTTKHRQQHRRIKREGNYMIVYDNGRKYKSVCEFDGDKIVNEDEHGWRIKDFIPLTD